MKKKPSDWEELWPRIATVTMVGEIVNEIVKEEVFKFPSDKNLMYTLFKWGCSLLVTGGSYNETLKTRGMT